MVKLRQNRRLNASSMSEFKPFTNLSVLECVLISSVFHRFYFFRVGLASLDDSSMILPNGIYRLLGYSIALFSEDGPPFKKSGSYFSSMLTLAFLYHGKP